MILVCLPTRNRPENVKRWFESWKKTNYGKSRVVIMADSDDENDYTYTGFTIDVAPRRTVIEKMNQCMEKYGDPYTTLAFIGDDAEFETMGWDDIMESKMGGRFCIIRPSNGYDIHENPDHIFISKDLYRFIGYFAFQRFHHGFVDHAWLDLTRLPQVNYIRANDVVIKHHHFLYDDKVKVDRIYKDAYKPELLARDSAIKNTDWQVELQRIKDLFTKVHLIMVTFNRLDYLKLSLQSLLNQTYKDFTLEIIDNCSNGNVLEYLDTINDPRVEIIKRSEPASLGAITADSFKRSKHTFVGKVDPDTLLPPNWLERIVRARDKYHSGFLGGLHYRPEDMNGLTPILEENNGVTMWRKHHIGGCAFLIERKDFLREDFENLSNGKGLFGLTEIQHAFDARGLHNGYLWEPPLYVELMDDARSEYCIKTREYEDYIMATRGKTIEGNTAANIGSSYLKENARVSTS